MLLGNYVVEDPPHETNAGRVLVETRTARPRVFLLARRGPARTEELSAHVADYAKKSETCWRTPSRWACPRKSESRSRSAMAEEECARRFGAEQRSSTYSRTRSPGRGADANHGDCRTFLRRRRRMQLVIHAPSATHQQGWVWRSATLLPQFQLRVQAAATDNV